MARPRNPGLIYFNLDVDFFSDPKIRILMLRYGADGIAIYLYLLCQIYRQGYFLKWNEDTSFIAANDLNMQVDKVQQVIAFLLERSMFDKQLFQSDAALTSTGIQERYQEAVKGKAQKNPIDVTDYWLLSNEETQPWLKVANNSSNSENNTSNSENNTSNSENNHVKQIKSKQIKSKQTREEVILTFDKFWALYPKKTGKQAALKKWNTLTPDLKTQNKMLNALDVQKKSDQWTKDNGQFIPNPATWLNQGRWEDEPSAYPKGGTIKRTNGKSDNVGNFQQRKYSEEDYSKFYVDIMKEKI